LARAVAERLDAVVLDKDLVRAALFPGRLTDYSREQDDLVFAMLLEGAKYLAARRRAEFVFLDGRTFSRREQVDQAVQAAKSAGCGWKILLAACPDEIAEARLAADAAKHPAGNRTVDLYRELKARFEPIALPHLEIDTAQSLDLSAKYALRYLSGADSPIE
jgi:predicted kinase